MVPVLCCGLPLLIAAGAAGTLAAVLANTWTISAASAVLVVAVVWRLATRRRGRHECGPHLQRRHTNE